MNVNIRAVGIELTPAIREYVEEKFATLEKFEPSIIQADVHIGKDTNHHHKGEVFSCSATMEIPGDVLKVERAEEDLYKAIDKVKDHLRETLAQHKERRVDERQNGE